jgi:outer membrane immunogenic protein
MIKSVVRNVACVAAIAGVSAASAADLPVTKAPVYVAAPTWTGFYIGGHIGGAWGEEVGSTLNTTALALAGTQTPGNYNGFLGGVQAGYNYQISPNWVIGIEGDWSWTNAKGTTTTASLVPGVTLGGSTTVKWYSTLTGRVGYTAGNWLLYVKGGGAWSNADYNGNAMAGAVTLQNATTSVTHNGWTVGAGLEFMLTGNWTARAEYNYLDFGTSQVQFVFAGLGVNGANVTTQAHLAKFGLNYKFGGVR